MDRETKTITTPVGNHEIVLRTYITGREKRELTNVFLTKELKFDADTHNLNGLDYTAVDKAQDLAWKIVIVSINGSSEDIVNKILDMRVEDYNFIVKAVNEITADKSFEEKKTI